MKLYVIITVYFILKKEVLYMENITDKIASGKTFLGIEFGSTRIKACLTDDNYAPIAEGAHSWENRLENGLWTYSLDDIHNGLQSCFAALKADVKAKYGVTLKTAGAMGISAMMHGFMPFDENGVLLTPFRTWRNTNTGKAADELTEKLSFNIPLRWSISHLYQAVLDNEDYIGNISYVTTLAVYIHHKLTGRMAAGIGEASGMFPVKDGTYDSDMVNTVNALFKDKGFDKDILTLFPDVLSAGESGGVLTAEGALFLDPDGDFEAGIELCPPEGDAGTGMAAANAVRPLTGNVSAGTSVFAMPVLDKPLSGLYREIDVVATPDGAPVAMVHCNNCCAELDAWVKMFSQFAAIMGYDTDISDIYEKLYTNAMAADKDCGGFTAYNYLSGEPVTGVDKGFPMYFRTADSSVSVGNFMRAQLYSAFAALKSGMDILTANEGLRLNSMTAHGGIFKVKGAAQQVLADALDIPVCVTKTAGEGGAWGMALLAAYRKCGNGKTLADWLDEDVFPSMEKLTLSPDADGVRGFDDFMKRYNSGLAAEKKLGEVR